MTRGLADPVRGRRAPRLGVIAGGVVLCAVAVNVALLVRPDHAAPVTGPMTVRMSPPDVPTWSATSQPPSPQPVLPPVGQPEAVTPSPSSTSSPLSVAAPPSPAESASESASESAPPVEPAPAEPPGQAKKKDKDKKDKGPRP